MRKRNKPITRKMEKYKERQKKPQHERQKIARNKKKEESEK